MAVVLHVLVAHVGGGQRHPTALLLLLLHVLVSLSVLQHFPSVVEGFLLVTPQNHGVSSTTSRRSRPSSSVLKAAWSGSSNYLEGLKTASSTVVATAALEQEHQHQPQPQASQLFLPEGWTQYIDPASGNPYYHNAMDGTTTWDRPVIPPPTSTTSSSGMMDWSKDKPIVPVTQEKNMNVEQDFYANNIPASTVGSKPNQKQSQQQQEMEQGLSTSPELEDLYLEMVSTETNVKILLGQNPYALTDLPLDVVWSKSLDQIEDAMMKFRSNTVDYEDTTQEQYQGRPTVVVLGTGWAAHAFVKLASHLDLKVLVVSPVNHFVFTPMLASAAVGTIEYRSMTEPIRVTNPKIENFIEGRAIGIDVAHRQLTVQLLQNTAAPLFSVSTSTTTDGTTTTTTTTTNNNNNNQNAIRLNYDHLICAVGTNVRSSMVPGAKEHCLNLKTSIDSKLLRTAIGEALEFASRPDVQPDYFNNNNRSPEMIAAAAQERRRRVRFVIIGGGPTGVELAAELNDFLQDICRPPKGAYQRLANDYSVILVHGGADLLPQFDPELRQRALLALEKRGVQVRLNTRTTQVGPDFVKLKAKGGDNAEEEVIPSGLAVWAAGNEPVPFVKELLSQLPESAKGTAGRINVDPWLRCPTPTPETFGSILVLGDAACLSTTSSAKSGGGGAIRQRLRSLLKDSTAAVAAAAAGLPQTAQVAGQQGAFAARLLNRGYDLRETPPRLPETTPYDEFSALRVWLLVRGLEEAPEFAFLNLGLLAYVGGGEALTQVQIGDVPLLSLAGKRAFALWRTVYLAKQAGTRNQATLVFDWAKSQAFGRDITRL